MTWTTEVSATTSAPLEVVYAVLADVTTWPEWNPGLREVRLDGPFENGTTAQGSDPVAAEVGAGASSDFAEVIEALCARSEGRDA